jgi:hypothetical protein
MDPGLTNFGSTPGLIFWMNKGKYSTVHSFMCLMSGDLYIGFAGIYRDKMGCLSNWNSRQNFDILETLGFFEIIRFF